jgi:hypothetical protein
MSPLNSGMLEKESPRATHCAGASSRSLKKPRTASSFETSRNDSCPALVDVFSGYAESDYLRSKARASWGDGDLSRSSSMQVMLCNHLIEFFGEIESQRPPSLPRGAPSSRA